MTTTLNKADGLIAKGTKYKTEKNISVFELGLNEWWREVQSWWEGVNKRVKAWNEKISELKEKDALLLEPLGELPNLKNKIHLVYHAPLNREQRADIMRGMFHPVVMLVERTHKLLQNYDKIARELLGLFQSSQRSAAIESLEVADILERRLDTLARTFVPIYLPRLVRGLPTTRMRNAWRRVAKKHPDYFTEEKPEVLSRLSEEELASLSNAELCTFLEGVPPKLWLEAMHQMKLTTPIHGIVQYRVLSRMDENWDDTDDTESE